MAVVWLISPRKVLTLVFVCVLAIGTLELASNSYLDRISSIEGTHIGAPKIGGDRTESNRRRQTCVSGGPRGKCSKTILWEWARTISPIRFLEYPGEALGGRGMWGRAAHSLWFTLLSELGIPGVILYALLLRANWRSLSRLIHLPADEPQQRFAYLLAIAFVAGLAGFFASGTFLSVLYYPHYWVLTALIVAAEKTLVGVAPGGPQPSTEPAVDG